MKVILRIIALAIAVIIIGFVAMEVSPFIGVDNAWLSAASVTIGFLLLWAPAVFPYIKGKDEDPAETWVGTLGPRIAGVYVYLIGCAAVIILCNVCCPGGPLAFRYQLMAHLALIFCLCMFLLWPYMVADKVAQVHHDEKVRLSGKANIKNALLNLDNTAALCPEMPAALKARITELKADARFITPNPSVHAEALESKISETADAIRTAINAGYDINADAIERYLDILTVALKNRKELLE